MEPGFTWEEAEGCFERETGDVWQTETFGSGTTTIYRLGTEDYGTDWTKKQQALKDWPPSRFKASVSRFVDFKLGTHVTRSWSTSEPFVTLQMSNCI